MRALYSVLFWVFFAASSAVFFVVALCLFLLTLPFDRKGIVLHLFSCFWAQLYFAVNPLWQLSIHGRALLPWKGAAVFVANHQSLGDILVLFGLYRPFKWVSKKSVFAVPFIGWNMRLNRYVGLVRGDKESITRMYQACEKWLSLGTAVLMFPEGTRSPDGEVKAFKDGAFRLAMKMRCPIYPIVVSGTARTLPKHGLVFRNRARCIVKVLPPVSPESFGEDVALLREHVRGLIVAEKERLEVMLDVEPP
jgi:1-acyl-sn-glycerol-3-phosphate acyltransferase